MLGRLCLRVESWAALEGAMGAVATALGAPGEWTTERREGRPDENFGPQGSCFVAALVRPGARLEYDVGNSDGNPRDGWGYGGGVRLHVGQRLFEGTWTSSGPLPTSAFQVWARAIDGADLLAAKGALERSLSPGCHESDAGWTARDNLQQADTPEVRAALARDAFAYGERTGEKGWGWAEVMAALAESEPLDPVKRLREAPEDPKAWKRAPPELAEVARIMEDRLFPWEAKGPWAPWREAWSEALGGGYTPEGWRVHENGLGPWRSGSAEGAGLSRHFAPPGGWPAGMGDGKAWRCAAWPEGASLPFTLTETSLGIVRWTWIGGPMPEDVLVIREEQSGGLQLPVEIFFAGTPEWKRRVEVALDVVSPYTWRPAPPVRERAARPVEEGPPGLEGALALAAEWPELEAELRKPNPQIPPITEVFGWDPGSRRAFAEQVLRGREDPVALAAARRIRAMERWRRR